MPRLTITVAEPGAHRSASSQNLTSLSHILFRSAAAMPPNTMARINSNAKIIPDIEGVIENLGKLTTTFHLPIFGVEGYDLGSTKKGNSEKAQNVIDFVNEYRADLNMLFTLSHPPESPDSSFEVLVERLQLIDTPIILENIPWQPDDTLHQKILSKQKGRPCRFS